MLAKYPPAFCRFYSLFPRLFLQLGFVPCASGDSKGDGKFLGRYLLLCEYCCHKIHLSTLCFQSAIMCKGIIGFFFSVRTV